MIAAATAKDNTFSTRENLDYINTLITGATENGEYCVFVDGKIFDDVMSQTLSSTYGYNVTKSYNNMGTFPTYKISWTPQVEPPSQTAIFFSSDVYGGARWFYAVMDFLSGQITGLIDTGLNVSDYSLWNIYPLQNKGYGIFFGGSDMKVLFVDDQGTIVNQYSGSTNYSYDVLEGKWIYWNDQGNNIFRAFNGDEVYSLSYENWQDIYIDWDWDGATDGGTFQYTLYDDEDGTDSIRLVKANTTMVELDLFNVNDFYHNTYLYMNMIIVEKYTNGNDQILEYKIYDEQGTLLQTIDVSGGDYNSQDVNMFGDNNFNVILYNSNDVNVPYRIITYTKESDILINETHDRGSEYSNWNTYTDSLGTMSTNDYYSYNFYVYFYDDGYGGQVGGLYNLAYCDLYYIESGSATSNLEVLQDSGTEDKILAPDRSMSARNLFMPFVDDDGYFKFKLFNSTGNTIRNTSILYSDILDGGWTNLFGDYYIYKIQTNNGVNDVMTVCCLKYDNSEYNTYQFENTNGWDDWDFYNIFILINNNDNSYRYLNSNSGGFQTISTGSYLTIHSNSSHYTSDFVMKETLVVYNNSENSCSIITDTTYLDNISLPTNENFYDIRVLKDYFVYLYSEPSTYNLIAKAYDFAGNEVNSINTEITNWSEGIRSSENRYWFSQYTDQSNQMIRYHLFTNNNYEQIDMSSYSDESSLNDIVWWD